MKSPADQKIIQIDITNACIHRCSNCTRHCGHHDKPFFMDLNTFKKAVDSLVKHPGMVGIMGGEPTIHPDFEKFIEYYRSKIGPKQNFEFARKPLENFTEHAEENLAFDTTKRRGLFSSLGNKYYEHFEIIQDTFSYQCLNDHTNPGMHQALLVARKDLGIPDDEWIKLRDKCWIQNLWSSSITPKGAFFCEVAASLDMLFDGPGGWPIEPDWWKRTPAEFGDQLKWCELCGAALQVPRRRANEETDDVSPTMFEKLTAANSPKTREHRVEVINTTGYNPETYKCKPSNEWYLPEEDNKQRINGTNHSLYPQHIDAIIVSRNGKTIQHLAQSAAEQFTNVILALNSNPDDMKHPASNISVLTVPSASRDALIAAAVKQLNPKSWVAVLDEDVVLSKGFADQLKRWILNPGCIYLFNRHNTWGLGHRPLIHTAHNQSPDDLRATAFCSLFHPRAHAVRDLMKNISSSDPVNPSKPEHWPDGKQIDMHWFFLQPDALAERKQTGREMAAHAVSLWQALQDCHRKIALYGAGHHTRWFLQLLEIKKLPAPVAIFDDNPFCQEINGIPVMQPQTADRNSFDTVVLSVDPGRMTEILKNRCKELWGNACNVVELYRQYPEGRFMKILPNPGH